MSSQDLEESHDMEQTSSEPLDWTGNTSKDNLDGGLDNASDSTNTSAHWDELGSYHVDKKAKVTHAPTSSLIPSPNNTNTDMMNSDIFSDDAEAAGSLQSLQARMRPEKDSVGTTTPPKECISEMLHGTSDDVPTDDQSPSSPAKAKVTHAPTSSLIPSPNNTNTDMKTSSIVSDNAEAAESLQSLEAHMRPKKDSVGTTTPREECFLETLNGTSDDVPTDDQSSSSPETAASYAKYRKSSADLMTLHIFTGKMKGTRPEYVPVYKRDVDGHLLKLLKDDFSGRWQYLEPEKWTVEENQGLKIFKKPKARGRLQRSGPKKAVADGIAH